MNSITCRKCGEEKPISEYTFRKDTGKYRTECTKCFLKYHNNYYKDNTEKIKSQMRELSRKYYSNNKEKKRKYALSNKEKIAERMHEYQKDYYQNNKDHINKRNNERDRKFPEKRAVITQRRRSLEAKAEGSFTEKEWQELCAKYENKCLCCKEIKRLTVDHVIPIARGGTNWITNIQPLCKSCNSKKGTKTIDYRVK